MKHAILFILLFLNFQLGAQMQLTQVRDYCFSEDGDKFQRLKVKKKLDGSGYVAVGFSRLAMTDGKAHHGVFNFSWNKDAYIGVLDNNFNLIKSNIFGGTTTGDGDDYFTDVYPTADGGYVCYGHAKSMDGDINAPAAYNMLLFKVDSNLNKVWSSPYGLATTGMWELDCKPLPNGDFMMLGQSGGPSGDNAIDKDGTPFLDDFTLVRMDGNGNKLWAKVYGGDGYDSWGKLLVDKTHIYIACEAEEGTADCVSVDTLWRAGLGGQTATDIFLMKIDTSGNRIWSRSYGGTDRDLVNASYYDSNANELLIGGYTESSDLQFSMSQFGNSNQNAFFMRLDTAGTLLQTKLIEGSHLDIVHDISLGPQAGTYFLGIRTQSGDGDFQGYTVGLQGLDVFLCLINSANQFMMKYSPQDVVPWGSVLFNTHIDAQTSEVLLHANFGGGIVLDCDTVVMQTGGGQAKPAVMFLRFDPLGLRQSDLDRLSLTLYPNPAHDKLYIKEEMPNNTIVLIAEMSGRVVKRMNYTNGQAIDLDALSAGQYLITIKSKEHFQSSIISIYPY